MRSWTAGLLAAFAMSCGDGKEFTFCEERLYGEPTVSTGLSDASCASECGCGEAIWAPHRLTDETLDRMTQLTLTNPVERLSSNPYDETPQLQPQAGVCATLLSDDGQSYRLMTFPSGAEAERAGAVVTHAGACGQCSSLENLVVYARYPDLTDPVRDCGVDAIFAGLEDNIACLRELGFDEACAQIWAYNTTHTREVCLEPCLELLDAPHHNPDGSLNACIQCDEDESGPVFKAVAGRTRRNSGLPSALCRPCDSVSRISHAHWEDQLRP